VGFLDDGDRAVAVDQFTLRTRAWCVILGVNPLAWMELMTPSIGRIVHYTNLGDRDGRFPVTIQAAIITGINPDGTVSLHVFYRTGSFDCPSVPFSEAPAGSEAARGCWGWPAKVV
jgi:hypothetical protein